MTMELTLPPWDAEATDFETLELLEALVRLTKPQIIVEAGTYRGHGTLYMARACRINGCGHVYTADPYGGGAQTHWFRANQIEERVSMHVGDYLDMLEGLIWVDFAFIDATARDDTGARLRWQHFEATKAKLSLGGLIVVHDTAADDWQDGEDGQSVVRIRDTCQLNIPDIRGCSIYRRET